MKTASPISALRRCKRPTAFTLVEAMILVVILGITAAVVGQSLTTMSNSAVQNNRILEINDALLSQMEALQAPNQTILPMPTVSTPSTGTTSISINGVTYTINNLIECEDPGVGTAQSNFLLIQVSIGTQSMTTYVSE